VYGVVQTLAQEEKLAKPSATTTAFITLTHP
ncbi:MAG: hypothetical protein ACI90V_000157, partial [Bacillariaceae sp.]